MPGFLVLYDDTVCRDFLDPMKETWVISNGAFVNSTYCRQGEAEYQDLLTKC